MSSKEKKSLVVRPPLGGQKRMDSSRIQDLPTSCPHDATYVILSWQTIFWRLLYSWYLINLSKPVSFQPQRNGAASIFRLDFIIEMCKSVGSAFFHNFHLLTLLTISHKSWPFSKSIFEQIVCGWFAALFVTSHKQRKEQVCSIGFSSVCNSRTMHQL